MRCQVVSWPRWLTLSGPAAEGPTIQRSSERALVGGTSLRRILGLLRELRPQLEVRPLLMGYANPFLAMGPTGFAEAASEVGVDKAFVADLPAEEGRTSFETCRERGMEGVLLVARTTTRHRLAMLVRETQGFLYYMSLTGVTGARENLAAGIERRVCTVRELGDVPVCGGLESRVPSMSGRWVATQTAWSRGGHRRPHRRCQLREAAVASFIADLKEALSGV